MSSRRQSRRLANKRPLPPVIEVDPPIIQSPSRWASRSRSRSRSGRRRLVSAIPCSVRHSPRSNRSRPRRRHLSRRSPRIAELRQNELRRSPRIAELSQHQNVSNRANRANRASVSEAALRRAIDIDECSVVDAVAVESSNEAEPDPIEPVQPNPNEAEVPAVANPAQPVLIEPVDGQRVVFHPENPANHSNQQRNHGRALPTDALLTNEDQYLNAIKNFNKRWPKKLQALFNQTETSGFFFWYDRRLLGSARETNFNMMASRDLQQPCCADVLEYLQTAAAHGMNSAFARHTARIPTHLTIDEEMLEQQSTVDSVSKTELLSLIGDLVMMSYRSNLQMGMAAEFQQARRLSISSRNQLYSVLGIDAEEIPILPAHLGLSVDQIAPMPHFDAFQSMHIAESATAVNDEVMAGNAASNLDEID